MITEFRRRYRMERTTSKRVTAEITPIINFIIPAITTNPQINLTKNITGQNGGSLQRTHPSASAKNNQIKKQNKIAIINMLLP